MFVLLLCPRCTSRDEFAGGKFVGFCNILQLHVAAFCWSLCPSPKAAGGPTSALLSSLEDCPWLQHKRLQCSRDLPAEVKAQPLEHRGVWQGTHALLLTATIAADKAVWNPLPPLQAAPWMARYNPKGLWHLHLLQCKYGYRLAYNVLHWHQHFSRVFWFPPHASQRIFFTLL